MPRIVLGNSLTKTEHSLPLAILALFAALTIAACENGSPTEPTAVANPVVAGSESPALLTQQAPPCGTPPCGGGSGGAGGGQRNLTFGTSGGVVTSATFAADVKKDNGSTLELTGSSGTLALSLSSLTLADCATGGVGGVDGKLTHGQLLSLLQSSSGPFEKLIVDKAAAEVGMESTSHHIGMDISTAVSGTVNAWFGDTSISPQAPVPSGATSPLVEVSTSAGVDSYMWTGGIVLAKHLRGKPKEHPVIQCNMPSTVTFTVEPTS